MAYRDKQGVLHRKVHAMAELKLKPSRKLLLGIILHSQTVTKELADIRIE